jgi:hypothetical protein
MRSMKGTILWDVNSLSANVYARFGGMYCLYLRGEREAQVSNKQQAGPSKILGGLSSQE